MENMEFLKAMLAEMNANMKANQEKVDANAKAMQGMLATIDTNRGTHCEVLKEMQAKMKDTMGSQIGFLVSRMEADRKTNQEEMKAAIQSI
jgi:5,10-methylene-tetrahydrofolate dehydrogenase/methenyl tetrahydrofolate cyclohydrolase